MSLLLENPTALLLTGGTIAAVLIFFWLQTGHRRLLQLLLVVVVGTAALLALESVVKTNRETVAETLHEIARLVELNEDDRALEYLHGSAATSRAHAERVLEKYEFERVRIKRNLKIVVDGEASPKRATATFNSVVALTHGTAGVRAHQPVAQFLTVELVQEGDRWFVTHFRHETPIRGYQRE